MAKWLDDVVSAMEALGGEASLDNLYREVEKVRSKKLTANWRAIVRRTVEDQSPDSENFLKIPKSRRKHIFDKVGRGQWRLAAHMQPAQTTLLAPILSEAADERQYDPSEIVDDRLIALAAIKVWRGQQAFRTALRLAHGDQCAFTGCGVLDVLEAAHITPYKGFETNDIQNGLLLRADLHTLFDCGLLGVCPQSYRILISPKLHGSDYECLAEQHISVPGSEKLRPSRKALTAHNLAFGL